jgi:hypothetical protein
MHIILAPWGGAFAEVGGSQVQGSQPELQSQFWPKRNKTNQTNKQKIHISRSLLTNLVSGRAVDSCLLVVSHGIKREEASACLFL